MTTETIKTMQKAMAFAAEQRDAADNDIGRETRNRVYESCKSAIAYDKERHDAHMRRIYGGQ
jgi:hypothetical protein